MQYRIEHETPGRIRVHLNGRVADRDVDPLIKAVSNCPAITKVQVYPRVGQLAVCYEPDSQARRAILDHLAALDRTQLELARSDYSYDLAPRSHSLLLDIATLVGSHFARKWFLPMWARTFYIVWHYRAFLAAALKSLLSGKLDVPVLDAAAIGISFIQRDPATAASTMFLLDLGSILEDYTRARSENELIYSLLNAPEKAHLIEDGQERDVPSTDLAAGDLIVVRDGMPISIDGVVERGSAMVNQASLTGEPLAVERTVGDDVFAGTAVERGEIFVRVSKTADATKLRSIVSLVEQAEGLKAQVQARRERFADAIVPWNFLLALVVAVSTRNLTKIAASLMVDYSCALKLTGSVSVLSAMSQAAKAGFTVKGSKHFEAMALADTIVFDKTGTLTAATPQVATVIAFDGWDRTQVLRLSACLEEHFPHPVARAVVNAAAARNLKHRERHAAVEYIVAHGIASSLDGERVVIGSRHFVVEDEHVTITPEQQARVDEENAGMSSLYLAVNGELKGVLGIEDPIKPGAALAVAKLRALGFDHIVMLTGDNEAAAERAAVEAGITEFRSNLLPEDKHRIVDEFKAQGRRVVMVGDGVNDSPALATADVGVAMANGTAIAKEVADITLTTGELDAIVRLRAMSQGLMGRLDGSLKFIMAYNSALLALGISGVITPQTSSLLHNASTVALGLLSTRAYDTDVVAPARLLQGADTEG